MKKHIVAIILNLIVVISTIIIVYNGIVFGAGVEEANTFNKGLDYFRPYTTDSNILAALCSLVLLIFNIKALVTKEYKLPKWVIRFGIIGAISVFLTFLIVVVILGPGLCIKGGVSITTLFKGRLFFHHLLNPLISVFLFCFLFKDYKLSKKDALVGCIPMFIYSIVYFLLVVVFGIWEDFYSFSFGGPNWVYIISLSGTLFITYLVARFIVFIHNKGKVN